MDYFFILGNHPELSEAEISARFPQGRLKRLGTAVIISQSEKLDIPELLSSIGGTIKAGRVIGELKKGISDPVEVSVKALEAALPRSGKFSFGISSYGKGAPAPKRIGMVIKNRLRERGVACRWVTSRETALSSVVVAQNKLLETGCELVFIGDGKEILLGETLGVQPFKELSRRDYGRPARDDHSGMLPPKLAQIMINLAQADKARTLLDPFCGSGTILTEALLLGYEDLIGTDISPKAIGDTEKNIAWIKEHSGRTGKVQLQVLDVREISSFFEKDSIGAVVAETYLGPQRGRVDVKKVSSELSELYTAAVAEIETVLKPGGRAVIALPLFEIGGKRSNLQFRTSLRREASYIYGREKQKVWREIIILKK